MKQISVKKWNFADGVITIETMAALLFIDLRDKSGLIQLVCDPVDSKLAHEVANTVKDEFVSKSDWNYPSKR